MRRLIYILTIFVVLVSACNWNDSRTSSGSSFTSQHLPEPDTLKRLKSQKTVIDTMFNDNEEKLLVFVKLEATDEVLEFEEMLYTRNGNYPKEGEIATSFNILKDSLGQIIRISEIPYIESSDWYIVLNHYFDKDGKTFAFERQTNFFKCLCTEVFATETLTKFYNSNFHLIEEKYNLTDKDNTPLPPNCCPFPSDYEYQISADIDEYLQSNGIDKNIR